jgi:uncharacterized membrane protein YphA (DoxX/SURF4 family)
MLDVSSLLNLLGRCLLASYFLKAGINNAYNFKNVRSLVTSKKIPFPTLVLVAVILTELLGSLAIIFDVYALVASLALIIFTLAANFLICNYWTKAGLEKRNISFIFYANVAVIGALLLVSGMAPRG